MKAAREQQSKKKGKRRDPPARASLSWSSEPLLNPSQSRSAVSYTVQAASRKSDENADNNEEGRGAGGWTEYTRNFLKGLQKWLNERVYFDQRGHHDLRGIWPANQLYGLLKPTDDPVRFMRLFGFLKEEGIEVEDDDRDVEGNGSNTEGSGPMDERRAMQASKHAKQEWQHHEMLTREDFALPDVLFCPQKLVGINITLLDARIALGTKVPTASNIWVQDTISIGLLEQAAMLQSVIADTNVKSESLQKKIHSLFEALIQQSLSRRISTFGHTGDANAFA